MITQVCIPLQGSHTPEEVLKAHPSWNNGQVACGESHAGCIDKDGAAYIWGKGVLGCLGDGIRDTHTELLPRPVTGLEAGVLQLDCGFRCTGALMQDGRLMTWGAGAHGHPSTQPKLTPTYVEGLPPITSFALGWHHAGAVSAEGTLYTWGRGEWGNLGLGTRRSHHTPQQVLMPEASAGPPPYWRQVSCGRGTVTPVEGPGADGLHTLAITEAGELWAWGAGHKGAAPLARLLADCAALCTLQRDEREPHIIVVHANATPPL
ncbi:hypothetical protein CYMTET_3439 [Cymbomonas tetramitiformis]|uniref:Uncharacterized protein n=1 Tax=Cymbomonas tetramitiformis TaxID=36881 RepID=A0AAE0H535_9CHLO|nr:hypothetical protein CYMTET_3439 [Cymbomonas tetramitiformis]